MAYSRQLVRSTWLAVFAVAILLPPAVVVFIERPRFRNLATELSLMTGLLAVSLLLATLTLPTRVNSILASFGIENVLRIHRLVAMLALLLVVVHIGLVFVGDPRGISIVNLSTAPAPVWAATTSAVALLALIGLGLRRRKRQPRYEGWRMLHIALALLVLGAAGLHVWWVGNLVHRPEMRFIYALLAEAALIVAIRRWIWLPLRSRGRAYKVESVTPISGNAVTVAVRANGHNVLPFHAGQFAWLKIGTSPFAFEEHPFTIASTAEQPDVKEFTIKALGDFSELLSELQPGRTVYLDGPYGRFTVEGLRNSNFVFIAGGVGITPMLSILRTLADRGDREHHQLLVGARSVDDLILRREVNELREKLDMTLTEVIQKPPPDWPGESGRIDGPLLDRTLPRHTRQHDYFICGPPGMVVAVGRELRERGIKPKNIHTEQFEVV